MTPGARRRHPNVVLIVLDTARADAFEPWGAATGSTPTVAQIASGGVVAPHAIAPSSWTVPSHVSLLSGQLPRTFGVGRTAAPNRDGFSTSIAGMRDRMMATVLGGAGFRTTGLSTNLWVSPDSGFDVGFDDFRAVKTSRRAKPDATSTPGRARWRYEVLRAKADDGAREVERELARHMAQPKDTPFFWFVNLVECHSPYLPPEPYGDLDVFDRWRSADDVRRHQSFRAFCVACLGGFDVSDDELQRMRHQYGRAISLLDDWLARLFDRLDSAGILDDTLVIVTSDHGENFGEGQLMGHQFSLDHRLIHVPFLAIGPGADAFAELRSLAEVPSRLARAVGVDRHPWRQLPLDVPGVAVSQLDPPARPGDPAAMAAIEDFGLDPDEALPPMVTPLTCAVEGRWKLLRRGDAEELYDLDEDPLELAPTAPSSAPADAPIASLRRAIDLAVAAEVPHGSEWETEPEELSDDVADQMRLLGYL